MQLNPIKKIYIQETIQNTYIIFFIVIWILFAMLLYFILGSPKMAVHNSIVSMVQCTNNGDRRWHRVHRCRRFHANLLRCLYHVWFKEPDDVGRRTRWWKIIAHLHITTTIRIGKQVCSCHEGWWRELIFFVKWKLL